MDGNKYFEALQLNISNIGRAASNQSEGAAYLFFLQGHQKVNVGKRSFIRSRDITAWKIGGPAWSVS